MSVSFHVTGVIIKLFWILKKQLTLKVVKKIEECGTLRSGTVMYSILTRDVVYKE